MKELTVEQKAQRYDKALEKAKNFYKGYKQRDNQLYADDLESIFPELKEESEDERIRKELIQFIKNWKNPNNIGHPHDFPTLTRNVEQCDRYIAWLEQQKEFVSEDFDDVWETADCDELTAPLEKYSKDAIKEMCHAWYDKGIELERKSWLEKQKPAEKYNITGIDSKNAQGKLGEMIKNLNPAWTEEDERIYQSIMDDIVQENQLNDKQTKWLRDIKYRYFPQPKQEWSEEDECCRHQLIVFCENCMVQDDGAKRCVHWLKSLKDRYIWKPNDEQMKALNAINITGDISYAGQGQELINLYNDLKKLKG